MNVSIFVLYMIQIINSNERVEPNVFAFLLPTMVPIPNTVQYSTVHCTVHSTVQYIITVLYCMLCTKVYSYQTILYPCTSVAFSNKSSRLSLSLFLLPLSPLNFSYCIPLSHFLALPLLLSPSFSYLSLPSISLTVCIPLSPFLALFIYLSKSVGF